MAKSAVLFFLLIYTAITSAQSLYLEVQGSSSAETSTIDSIGFAKKHPNFKALSAEVAQLNSNLINAGYLQSQITSNTKTTDSTFVYSFQLNQKVSSLLLYIGKPTQLKEMLFANEQKDTLQIPFSSVEAFLQNKMAELENRGFSLASLQLINLKISNTKLYADLKMSLGQPRRVNDIVINGYDKFPSGHLKNIKRLYKGKTFNQAILRNIQTDFAKFPFITQTKDPEILFSQDTTKVYIYLEKAKPNKFDGFIGFANDEESQKLLFTGYLDVSLMNFVNTGEELTVYWKSDGKEQKTFNTQVQLPYIFRTPFGVKAALNIFKQDSTFQNTKTALDVGYFFNYNTRLYLGYQSTESADIQNTNSFSLQDFKNSYLTSTFEYSNYNASNILFPETTAFNLKLGIGNRQSKRVANQQHFAELNAHHNVYLSQKNALHIRSQNYYLQSDSYIINELYRFGGINSVRGFQENSLQANVLSSILTEYRYIPAPNLYIHSIIDYGYFRDNSADISGSLLGLGIGFGILTNNGLLNLIYANGSTNDQSIKLSNSIVHLSFKTSF